jgi:hypothetical protein
MPPTGRPRALDDGKRREICALISAGCGIETAAEYVGCCPTTIRREAFRNEDFGEEFRNAQIASRLKPLRALEKATATHWRAAAWLLERTDPMRFSRRPPDYLTPDEVQDVFEQIAEKLYARLINKPGGKRVFDVFESIRCEVIRDVYVRRQLRRDQRRSRRKRMTTPPRPQPLPSEYDSTLRDKTEGDIA